MVENPEAGCRVDRAMPARTRAFTAGYLSAPTCFEAKGTVQPRHYLLWYRRIRDGGEQSWHTVNLLQQPRTNRASCDMGFDGHDLPASERANRNAGELVRTRVPAADDHDLPHTSEPSAAPCCIIRGTASPLPAFSRFRDRDPLPASYPRKARQRPGRRSSAQSCQASFLSCFTA